MGTYRITKFNPANRGENGAYLDASEWTSITDIGRVAYNSPTYTAYKETEDAYVNAILLILAENGIDSLKITGLEHHTKEADFSRLKRGDTLRDLTFGFAEVQRLREGASISVAEMPEIIRLILREVVWMVLQSDGIKVEFGYDYYMYVTCEKLQPATIEQIGRTGLFVEK